MSHYVPQGILSLCVLFENLLQTHEPALFYHLKEVGAHPLRLAFNWIIYAFAGYLDTEQLLLLWDRIFAYDSMELLAVFAMAILSYRRTNLLEVTNLQAAQTVLTDLSTLKHSCITTIRVVPQALREDFVALAMRSLPTSSAVASSSQNAFHPIPPAFTSTYNKEYTEYELHVSTHRDSQKSTPRTGPIFSVHQGKPRLRVPFGSSSGNRNNNPHPHNMEQVFSHPAKILPLQETDQETVA
ncbi:hypothetical protein OS493_029108 [Desmophyllum pertusum]|uniref:Rab-GAP TBC domain-containing protein n=1 Tax=Desmophyllum pertusum TaxID=174260 RepID=A0A9W9Y8Y9_9CNID|nr:hypothetical protein OS493_029108 [Desmophyllum pertusum]